MDCYITFIYSLTCSILLLGELIVMLHCVFQIEHQLMFRSSNCMNYITSAQLLIVFTLAKISYSIRISTGENEIILVYYLLRWSPRIGAKIQYHYDDRLLQFQTDLFWYVFEFTRYILTKILLLVCVFHWPICQVVAVSSSIQESYPFAHFRLKLHFISSQILPLPPQMQNIDSCATLDFVHVLIFLHPDVY